MTFNGTYGEIGNVLIGKFVYDVYLFCQVSETCAQYDGRVGAHLRVFFNPRCGFFDLF